MDKVSPEIFREGELLQTVRDFPVWHKSHKGFKEKDSVKNALDGVVKRWNLFEPVLIFILTLLIHFLKPSYSFGLIH